MNFLRNYTRERCFIGKRVITLKRLVSFIIRQVGAVSLGALELFTNNIQSVFFVSSYNMKAGMI